MEESFYTAQECRDDSVNAVLFNVKTSCHFCTAADVQVEISANSHDRMGYSIVVAAEFLCLLLGGGV